MNTPARIAITAVTTVVVFVTSFAVASAIATPPELSPADAPLAIPAFTRQEAEVLLPVAVGDSAGEQGEGDNGLSEPSGVAQVVVPEAVEGLGPEDPTPEGLVPPEVVEAAAFLDSVAGDASEIAGPEEPAVPDLTPGSEPPPASDPCAVEGAPAPEGDEDTAGCPEGATMTLLSLDGELTVYGAADPPPAAGMGSSIYCDPTGLADGALTLGAIASQSADVTITYWPQGNPSETTSVELTQVEEWADGWTLHCGATELLEPGDYEGQAFAISDDGIATPDDFTFDSRGQATIPNMRVVPLGSNWVWVGMLHTAYVRSWITGFELSADDAATCENEGGAPYLRTDVGGHISEVSAEYLNARNYNSAYTRVTSALFYVPPGTTAMICGSEWRESDPSWDAAVADRVQSAVVESPRGWTAVATLRNVRVFAPGSATLRALSQTGGSCGASVFIGFDAERSDTPSDFPRDDELCRIAGQNMQLEVSTSYRNEGGTTEHEETRRRVFLPTSRCTGACPEPEPLTYELFLPGLGQDECPDRTTDDCEVRRRVFGARATIDVTWEMEGEGTRNSWAIGTTNEVSTELPPSDSARFDAYSYVRPTLSTDGFVATAETHLKWDREVDYSIRTLGPCFNETPGAPEPAPVTGTARPAGTGVWEAVVNIRQLCPGTDYGIVVTFTDEAGNTRVAAGNRLPGVSSDEVWGGGMFSTPQQFIDVTATIRIDKNPALTNSYWVRDSWLYFAGLYRDRGSYYDFYPSFGPWSSDRCFSAASTLSEPDTVSIPLRRTYEIEPGINVFSDVGRYPTSATCEFGWPVRYEGWTNTTITLAQLLRGVSIDDGLQWHANSAYWPTPDDFHYTVEMRGEYGDQE
jgi:hypothetical protein